MRWMGALLLSLAVATGASAFSIDVPAGKVLRLELGDVVSPTPTPRPTRTPSPARTCLPGTTWNEVFGTCDPIATATPRVTAKPSPSPTSGGPPRLTGGPFKAGGFWFPGGETTSAAVGSDVVYAVDCNVANAFYEKHGRPIAPREAWNGFLSYSWNDPPEVRMQAAKERAEQLERCLEKRREQIRASMIRVASLGSALSADSVTPPIPELVSLETGTFGWATSMWGTGGGFLRKDGSLRPVSKWPVAIDEPHRFLWRRWTDAGGGSIISSPYAVTWAITLPPAWHAAAHMHEPLLFSLEPWKPYTAELDGVDFPDARAFNAAVAAFERWVQRFRFDCDANGFACGLVGQLTNGTYDRVPGGIAWQNRFIRQMPAILNRYGFEPDIQVELFDAVQARPAFDCPLYVKLRDAGAIVSAFDVAKGIATHDLALQCAGGGGLS